MVIKKQYNIGQLAETLQQALELSKKYNGVVKLDILTANDILEVLQEIHKREQKHQTLESAMTFIEKEEETNRKPDCFGKEYYNMTNVFVCVTCKHAEQCKVITKHE